MPLNPLNPQPAISRFILLVLIDRPLDVNQIAVTVHTFFFIARSRVQHGPVGQHGTSLVGDVKNVAMTLLALLVFKSGIGLFTLMGMVIQAHVFGEMGIDILYAVGCFGIEKIDRVMGCRQVTVHAVGHKPLGIIYVC